MKHFHDITIDVANTDDNKVIYEFNIDKGLITEAGVFFPPGCHGVISAKIYFQTHQILPRNQESWCHGNGGWWLGYMYFPVTAAPLKIRVEAYTIGSNHPHTITICIELMPWEQVPAWDKLIFLMEKLLGIFGVPRIKYPTTEMTMQ